MTRGANEAAGGRAARATCLRASRSGVSALGVALLLGGCAALPPAYDAEPSAFDAGAQACLERFELSDREIADAGTRDAGTTRVEGFAWLRTDRFLALLPDELEGEAAWHAWLHRLHRLDLDARRFELANARGLPPAADEIESDLDSLAACADTLNATVLDSEKLQALLRERARVPDDYRAWQRALGLYPLTRLFVLAGVNRLHDDLALALESEPRTGADAHWQSYTAQSRDESDSRRQVAPVRDALGIPQLEQADIDSLFDRYAPVWRVETRSDDDRLGTPEWLVAERPRVRTGAPVEYRYVSWARFDGQVVLQLNYLVWYPARSAERRFDIYAGHIDGTLWRVTLNSDGTVLAGESLHACGCYYMVFPGEGITARDPPPRGEPVFVGAQLPGHGTMERLRLTRAAANHYLVHIDTVAPATLGETLVRMPAADADELRSLAHPHGRRSLYRSTDGIVPGTDRPERWLLWPMGVASAGAMRQPGRHAIAFASRRHFDAPELLESLLQRVP